jgi:SAM-dependent methyltransferase
MEQPMSREEHIKKLDYHYATKEKIFLDSCNLCGSDDWVILTHRDRYGFAAQTAACGECGLAVMNPRMTAPEYAEFYANWYRPLVSAFHGRTIDAVSVQREQQLYSEEMETLVQPYLQARGGQSFLDVGGSTGVVAKHFTKCFGVVPTVIDPAPDEIQEANQIGLKTITALIEDWDPGELKYDIVGMFQTIDHLLDIRGTLEKIRSLIKPDGIFLVDIVDFRASYLKNGSVELATKIDHPYSLTEFVMECYLRRTGFKILRRAYSADYHLVAYVCKPVDPQPDHLPDRMEIREFFRELRFIQNSRPTVGGQV